MVVLIIVAFNVVFAIVVAAAFFVTVIVNLVVVVGCYCGCHWIPRGISFRCLREALDKPLQHAPCLRICIPHLFCLPSSVIGHC